MRRLAQSWQTTGRTSRAAGNSSCCTQSASLLQASWCRGPCGSLGPHAAGHHAPEDCLCPVHPCVAAHHVPAHSIPSNEQQVLACIAMSSSSSCTCCLASPACCPTGHGSIRSILDDMKLLSTEAEGVNDAIPDAFKTDHVNAAGRVGALLGLKPQGTGKAAPDRQLGQGMALQPSAHPQPYCSCMIRTHATHMAAHCPSVLQICRSK